MHKSMMLAPAAFAILMVTSTASLAADVTFDLKYGVLAGLTGDPAPDGQAWNEAARLAIEQIQKSLDRLKLSGIKVELSDSQDSQGSPQPGVEGAQKLVNVDHVQVIVGDFYSSVTSAVATSVTIPNNVLIFTGGTNPALGKLNAGRPAALVWEPSRQTIFRARFSPTSLRRNSAPRPRSTLPRATMAMERPSSPSSRTPGPPAVERSRNSSSTIRISRPSIPKRSRSPTAIPTVGCLSISTASTPDRAAILYGPVVLAHDEACCRRPFSIAPTTELNRRLIREGQGLRFRMTNIVPERHTRYLQPLYSVPGFWPYWVYFDLAAPPLY